MLSDKKIKTFIPTLDPKISKEFYMNVLGLRLLSEDQYALAFDANGTVLRVTSVPSLTPHPFTVLGWDVDDLVSTIQSLNEKGVRFEKYEFLEQDELAIWTAPNGSRVAWFKDPDGNLLSLSK